MKIIVLNQLTRAFEVQSSLWDMRISRRGGGSLVLAAEPTRDYPFSGCGSLVLAAEPTRDYPFSGCGSLVLAAEPTIDYPFSC